MLISRCCWGAWHFSSPLSLSLLLYAVLLHCVAWRETLINDYLMICSSSYSLQAGTHSGNKSRNKDLIGHLKYLYLEAAEKKKICSASNVFFIFFCIAVNWYFSDVPGCKRGWGPGMEGATEGLMVCWQDGTHTCSHRHHLHALERVTAF